jgi:hypothetical protein
MVNSRAIGNFMYLEFMKKLGLLGKEKVVP